MPEVIWTLVEDDDNFGIDREIGKGKDLLISTPGSGPPQMIFEKHEGGRSWYRMENFGWTEARARIHDWKTPAPDPFLPQPAFRDRTTVEDAQILIASLVRVLGGSVTISTTDLEAVVRGQLVTYMMDAPKAMVLKYEEPE